MIYIIIGSISIVGYWIGTFLVCVFGFLFMNLILKPSLFILMLCIRLYCYILSKRIKKNKKNKICELNVTIKNIKIPYIGK